MTPVRMLSVLVLAGIAAACSSGNDRPYKLPEQGEERRPQRGPAEDGVPAADCLLKPMAGADGALTAAELVAGIKAGFAAADLDHDGWLSKAETQRYNASRANSCDRSPLIAWSATGLIDVNDFGSRYRTAFERTDANGDGVVSADEMQPRRPREDRPEDRRERMGDGVPNTGPDGRVRPN